MLLTIIFQIGGRPNFWLFRRVAVRTVAFESTFLLAPSREFMLFFLLGNKVVCRSSQAVLKLSTGLENTLLILFSNILGGFTSGVGVAAEEGVESDGDCEGVLESDTIIGTASLDGTGGGLETSPLCALDDELEEIVVFLKAEVDLNFGIASC
jgi:hypothetical protein